MEEAPVQMHSATARGPLQLTKAIAQLPEKPAEATFAIKGPGYNG
jgi:hypothetical protein